MNASWFFSIMFMKIVFLSIFENSSLFSERAKFHIQRANLENLHSLQDRLQDADTWRDVLQKKLRESEMKSKTLRDQQRALREQKVYYTVYIFIQYIQ